MTDEKGTPDDWDPEAHEKQWFSHGVTGDLGWLVRREGKDYIRLDRPDLDEIRPYEPSDWRAKAEHRPISPAQLAMVMFMADKQYCLTMGMYEKAREDWASLSQKRRRVWIETGPTEDPDRARLYAAIKGALGHLAG